MVIGNFRNFPENFGFLNKYDPLISKNNVNLILFSQKIIDGNVFFKIRLKESTIGLIFILKFVIFPKLVKIDIFKEKQKQT